MAEHPELMYKILIVGAPFVGKTCLIRRYVHGVFTPTSVTVMVDFSMKVLAQADRTVNLRLWDIQGQEQPGYLGRTYYGGAVGAMVVCDVSAPETLEQAVMWKRDISSKVFLSAASPGGQESEPIPCFLCVNKCDLQDPCKDKMNAFCQEHGFAGWMATSGMKDIGVTQAFSQLVSAVDRMLPKAGEDPTALASTKGGGGFVPSGREKTKQKKSCPCR